MPLINDISWDLKKVGIPEYDESNPLYNKHFEWFPSDKFYELQVSMFDLEGKYTRDAIELFWSNIELENVGCQLPRPKGRGLRLPQ